MGTEDTHQSGENGGDLRPSTERLEHQLQLVSSARVGEDQVAWTIFAVFWAAEVLLVGVFFQGNQFPPNAVSGFGVSLLGAIMSIAWAITQHRSLSCLERHEHLIELIETKLANRGDLLAEHRLTGGHPNGPRARTVMRACAWAATAIWLVSTMLFACGMWEWIACRG